jgi:hypothetical protein
MSNYKNIEEYHYENEMLAQHSAHAEHSANAEHSEHSQQSKTKTKDSEKSEKGTMNYVVAIRKLHANRKEQR